MRYSRVYLVKSSRQQRDACASCRRRFQNGARYSNCAPQIRIIYSHESAVSSILVNNSLLTSGGSMSTIEKSCDLIRPQTLNYIQFIELVTDIFSLRSGKISKQNLRKVELSKIKLDCSCWVSFESTATSMFAFTVKYRKFLLSNLAKCC